MSQSTRVTIRLPAELLQAAEQKLGKGEASRSELIRRIIENALRNADDPEKVAQYVREYSEHPQTEDEVPWPTPIPTKALKQSPSNAKR